MLARMYIMFETTWFIHQIDTEDQSSRDLNDNEENVYII